MVKLDLAQKSVYMFDENIMFQFTNRSRVLHRLTHFLIAWLQKKKSHKSYLLSRYTYERKINPVKVYRD